ncbi:unnamed protein product [Trichogramma brassicae]|uniref:Uncharacterized protein n=1 Tax=Trichogramma brassicae TaxID=86971 RepID=A0A6H5INR2_9HYME|nr:unnamed protein product [Trichogramma brassicae]
MDVVGEMNLDHPPSFHQKNFERLKCLRDRLNWDVEEERHEFLRRVDPLINDWLVQPSHLREMFKEREIECLLTDCMTYWREVDFHSVKLGRFVKFVSLSGYKNGPELGEDGKPLLRRTTALHLAARRCFIGRQEVVDDLFEIYDGSDANYVDDDGLSHFHVACMF